MSRVKDSDIIGLPVICSRLFWFSSFCKIKTAKDFNVRLISPIAKDLP